MKPTVGRIVHYIDILPEPFAAIITSSRNAPEHEPGTDLSKIPEESQWEVCLVIFWDVGQRRLLSVPYSETYKQGHWSWPPRS